MTANRRTVTKPQAERLISVDHAARYLDVDPRTIRRWVADGWLSGYRIGPRIFRVDRLEIEALIEPVPTAAEGGVRT